MQVGERGELGAAGKLWLNWLTASSNTPQGGMTSDSEMLHRAFLDFAETVQSLKTYIARTGGEEEEEEEDPFAQLALETLTLWCSKVRRPQLPLPSSNPATTVLSESSDAALSLGTSIGAVLNPLRAANVLKGRKKNMLNTGRERRKKKIRPVEELDSVVAVGVDSMTSLLRLDANICSSKLVSAGAITALIHAMRSSGTDHLTAATCCCVQNLASIDLAMRQRLIEAGVLKGVKHVLSRTSSTEAAAAACGIVQNLAADSACLDDILASEVVAELVGLTTRSYGAEDPTLPLAASKAMLNIAAGGEDAVEHMGACRAAHSLAALLEFQSRPNKSTGVMEVHAPDLALCACVGKVLSTIACLPSLQGSLYASGCLSTIPPLLHRYLEDGWEGTLGEAIGALLSVVHNAANVDVSGKARDILLQSHGGSALARMIIKMVPEADPRKTLSANNSPMMSLATTAVGTEPVQPSMSKQDGRTAERINAGAATAPAKGAKGDKNGIEYRGLGVAGAVLLDKALASLRNLTANTPDLCEQVGAAGGIPPICRIVMVGSSDQPPPWCSNQLVVDSLFALANLTDICDANRTHVLASGITQRTMLIAGGGGVGVGVEHRKSSGAAAVLLQSLSVNARCRMRLIERDCVRLMYEIMSAEQSSPIQIAGTAGTVVNLCKTMGQMQKFVTLGGCILVSRLCYESTHPAVLRSVLQLIMVMAADDDLRKHLMQEGAVRATLNILDESKNMVTPVCELACEALMIFAADPGARLHMTKIGVIKVLETFGDSKQNRWKSERVSFAARTTLHRLGYQL